MRLHIEHTTRYVYERPVRFGRHRLVLRPREGHDLRVERMQLLLEPAHRVVWIRDVFGNSIALVDWLEPADVLTIVNDVIVERLTPFPGRELHEPWRVPFPVRYEPPEIAITGVYQSPVFPRRRVTRAGVADAVADAGSG
jgi:transglutaminase-like putative cysteine protease